MINLHPFVEHLSELRTRLLWSLAVIFGFFILFYVFKEPLLEIVLQPLQAELGAGQPLIFTGVPDIFFTYLKMSIWLAFFAGLPIILWHVWRFVAPGLYENEQRIALPLLVATPGLFYAGIFFTWAVIMPVVVTFFLSFQTETIQAMLSVKEYLGFFVRLALGFGLAFELPVLVLLLAKAGIVSPATLAKARRFVWVGIVVFAAFFTPPDPASQMLLAVPMALLYEAGVLCARLTTQKESSKPQDQASAS